MEMSSKDKEVCFGISSPDLLFKFMDLLNKQNVVVSSGLTTSF